MPQTEEFSEFQIHKTARIITLLGVIYPNMFGGPNQIYEILKPSASNIARTTLIDFRSLDQRSSLLFSHSIIKGIYKGIKKIESPNQIKGLLIIPESHNIMPKEQEKIISKDIISLLKTFQDYGLIFSVATQAQIDISDDLKNEWDAKINVVNKNDVGVQLRNRKAYRVLVRPTLSNET